MPVSGFGVGPAEDGEGKQAGGEPGVEDVGLLRDVGGVAGFAVSWCFARDGDGGTGFAVPRGNAMAPPELAGDAPVVDVTHPLVVGLAVLVGRELDVALVDGFDGLVGEWLDLDEPLLREARLDDDAGALREANGVGVFFYCDEEALGFEVGDDALASFVAVEAVIGRAGEEDVRGLVEDGEVGQIVALADGEVVGVVRGRDFYCAGAELGLGPVVGEDGDLAVGLAVDAAEREADEVALKGEVALVGWVYRNGYVAEHGFGTSGGDDDTACAVG